MTEVTRTGITFEQWSLAADTSGPFFGSGTGAITTVPFATRDTTFDSLGNSMSSGVLTLSSAVKSTYKAVRMEANFEHKNLAGNDDFFDVIVYANSRARSYVIHHGTSWTAVGNGPLLCSAFIPLAGIDDLEIAHRGENTYDMASAGTFWTLEFTI